jgi:hypothetical protein
VEQLVDLNVHKEAMSKPRAPPSPVPLSAPRPFLSRPALEGLGGAALRLWPIRWCRFRLGVPPLHHAVEAPTVRDALQLVLARVLERETGTRDEVLHGLRDQNL